MRVCAKEKTPTLPLDVQVDVLCRELKNMPERVLENPTPKVFREDGSENVAAATYTTRTGLLRKQAVDMEIFWEKYVKEDRRLLSMLCSEFRQYTVETLLWVPFNSTELFQEEVAWDSYFSSLEGFDAYGVLNQARRDVRGELSYLIWSRLQLIGFGVTHKKWQQDRIIV